MRQFLLLAALVMGGLLLTGCAYTTRAPLTGFLYTNVKDGDSPGPAAAPTKTGRACANSILGLVAKGDASIEAAAQQGGISTISYVDHESKVYVLVYAEYCTIVRGT
jgi:hypothetical protein